jgi:hypothetical protein
MNTNNLEGNLTKEVDWGTINIWKQGRAARLELMPRNLCPYLVNTNEYRSWLSGYYSADSELKE